METETDKQLPFTDVFINNVNNNLTTSVFHKSTYGGLLEDFTSFTYRAYKIDLIKCLIDRAYKINNTWIKVNSGLINIKSILKRSSYPTHRVDKVDKSTLKKILPKGIQRL